MVDRFVYLPVNNVVHNAIAFVVANEISLLANFIPNDYFTFRRMAGNRTWGTVVLVSMSLRALVLH